MAVTNTLHHSKLTLSAETMTGSVSQGAASLFGLDIFPAAILPLSSVRTVGAFVECVRANSFIIILGLVASFWYGHVGIILLRLERSTGGKALEGSI